VWEATWRRLALPSKGCTIKHMATSVPEAMAEERIEAEMEERMVESGESRKDMTLMPKTMSVRLDSVFILRMVRFNGKAKILLWISRESQQKKRRINDKY
jgi:hypothetical protein